MTRRRRRLQICRSRLWRTLIPLLRLSPRDPLRWARAGAQKAAPRMRKSAESGA